MFTVPFIFYFPSCLTPSNSFTWRIVLASPQSGSTFPFVFTCIWSMWTIPFFSTFPFIFTLVLAFPFVYFILVFRLLHCLRFFQTFTLIFTLVLAFCLALIFHFRIRHWTFLFVLALPFVLTFPFVVTSGFVRAFPLDLKWLMLTF